jgi:hypothetical protein
MFSISILFGKIPKLTTFLFNKLKKCDVKFKGKITMLFMVAKNVNWHICKVFKFISSYMYEMCSKASMQKPHMLNYSQI